MMNLFLFFASVALMVLVFAGIPLKILLWPKVFGKTPLRTIISCFVLVALPLHPIITLGEEYPLAYTVDKIWFVGFFILMYYISVLIPAVLLLAGSEIKRWHGQTFMMTLFMGMMFIMLAYTNGLNRLMDVWFVTN